MKITFRLLALILPLLLTQCTDKINDLGMAQEQLKQIPAQFSEQSSTFAFDFWKQHNSLENKQKNHFVSPLSLHIALGMLLNGADGKTKEEITKVLRVSDNLAETNQIYKSLIKSLPLADTKVANTIANSVWYDKNFTVEKSYLDVLNTFFSAQAFNEDFSNTLTVNKINQWASDNTNAKIQKVLDRIDPSHVMFLMNALYFKGDWTNQFKIENTYDKRFLNLNGVPQNVKMMNKLDKFRYAKRVSYHAVELPYGDDNYRMTVLLPLPTISALTPDAIINNINVNEWQELNKALVEQKTLVEIPRFSISYESELNNVLSKMGMPTVFTDMADLSKISPPVGKIKVGFVKQNTFLNVDEKGSEAAAVTTIGIEVTSAPIVPEFICNRPFVFIISEKNSNTILFMGKVVNL